MTATLDQRVWAAITAYFRAHGYSPSHRDIARAVGDESDLAPGHVGRHLARLAGWGLLTYVPGRARSIVLTRPFAGCSDEQWELEGLRRGYQQPVRSRLPALAAAFADGAIMGTDAGADLVHLLDKLD